jgi:tRNA-2-methylthio-N6-dimethylallyladenosine synthase
MAAFGRLEKLCHHIHLPVQSGSDKILHCMNRKYTRAHFAERVARLRADYPDIAVTSDIIVGFPGETDSDFGMTLDLIRSIRFDSLFAFKYSDRPNAAAAQFTDKIPATEKSRRLKTLLDLQNQITLEKNKTLIGTKQVIMVEGFSKISVTKEVQWSGRTSTNKIVNFQDDRAQSIHGNDLTGRLIPVVIKKGFYHSLLGTPVTKAPIHVKSKGVPSRAA